MQQSLEKESANCQARSVLSENLAPCTRGTLAPSGYPFYLRADENVDTADPVHVTCTE